MADADQTQKRERPNPPARVTAILARDGRKAVVFRRGPSRSVLLLSWNLAKDELTPGHWYRGRLYERRCDLSPDGDLLVYFVGYKGPFVTWTAVSRPPYLTALALWPKGDGWGGGGLFEDGHRLMLNHASRHTALAPGYDLPPGFMVEPLGSRPGWGEDEPIFSQRMRRDGWDIAEDETVRTERKKGRGIWLTYEPPYRREKAMGRKGIRLRVFLHGIKEDDGPWYVQSADLTDATGEAIADLGRIDWADVDTNGDALYAKEGCLYRLRLRDHKPKLPWEPVLVADLNPFRFKAVPAPAEALKWPKSARSAGFVKRKTKD